MLKGCQKQIIVLRGTGSEIFEEAYFVLKKSKDGSSERPSGAKADVRNAEMLLEANRILEDCRVGGKAKRRTSDPFRSAVFFSVGLIIGALLILAALALT